MARPKGFGAFQQPSRQNGSTPHWPIGKFREGASYRQAPKYFDNCWAWYKRLSEDQQDWSTYVVDAFTHFGEEVGKRYAARLPVAPRRPL
jgi:hypothetical protein